MLACSSLVPCPTTCVPQHALNGCVLIEIGPPPPSPFCGDNRHTFSSSDMRPKGKILPKVHNKLQRGSCSHCRLCGFLTQYDFRVFRCSILFPTKQGPKEGLHASRKLVEICLETMHEYRAAYDANPTLLQYSPFFLRQGRSGNSDLPSTTIGDERCLQQRHSGPEAAQKRTRSGRQRVHTIRS